MATRWQGEPCKQFGVLAKTIDNRSVYRYNVDMNLQNLLEEKNISKYRLSKITGIPKTTIIDICAGRSSLANCSARTVQLLAEALECSMEDIMKLDTGAVYNYKELKRILKPIFESYGVKKATLFGSYAKGTANNSSDVDILVDSGLHGLNFFGLLESVTNALRTSVDLIDIHDVEAGSEIDREIKNTGVLLYG